MTKDERLRIRSVRQLADHGLVAPEAYELITDVVKKYALSITGTMLSQIGDCDDAVGRQFVPSSSELMTTAEELDDPISDEKYSPVPGIVHRHSDRVLLKPTLVCPVYCRFCFRREVVGPRGGALSREELARAMDYIRSQEQIWEVILTGGDPLILAPSRLLAIMRDLDRIDHVKVVRVHTRVPIVDPRLVDAELIDVLQISKPVWIAVHCNHSNEIGGDARAALSRLSSAGIPLISQTVLLKGVNDSAEILADLFRTLVENKVKPYYLHQGDLAHGTSHFRTSIEDGLQMTRTLRRSISGICQPAYVLDVPDGHGKIPVAELERGGG